MADKTEIFGKGDRIDRKFPLIDLEIQFYERAISSNGGNLKLRM